MSFVPIRIPDYVRLYLKSNPGEKAADIEDRLRKTLKASQAGARCTCGEPIWVIGSAEVGHMCFTCITGEAYPSDDYEIADAVSGRGNRARRQTNSSSCPAVTEPLDSPEGEDFDVDARDDEDVPF
jgi:hypothetical protein